MRCTKWTKTSLSLLRPSGKVPMQSFELGPRGHTLWQEMSEFTNEVPVKIQDAKVRLQHEEKKGARSEAQQCIMRSSLTCKILIGLADSDKSEVHWDPDRKAEKAEVCLRGLVPIRTDSLDVFCLASSMSLQTMLLLRSQKSVQTMLKAALGAKDFVSHLQICKKLAFRRRRHQPASKSFHIKLEADSARPSSKPVTTFHEVERWNQMRSFAVWWYLRRLAIESWHEDMKI